MPFGLRNAGSTFQLMMDRVLAGLPFIFVYLGNVLVVSPNHVSHKKHLRALLPPRERPDHKPAQVSFSVKRKFRFWDTWFQPQASDLPLVT